MDSKTFWETKKSFVEKYNANFINYFGEAPETEEAQMESFQLTDGKETPLEDARLFDYK